MVSIKNIARSKDKLRIGFVLCDATSAYANALRRAIISLVPTLAVEDVEFYENNSALYDETIAHRLALLPLVTDLDSYVLPAGEAAEGVSRAGSEVKLTLDAKGPCTVFASELKAKDPKVKCAFPQMPIVKLLKNQTIRLEATALLGQGVEHMKWAAAAAHFQHLPIIKDGAKSIELTPKDVLDEKQMELFVKADGTLNIPVTKSKNVQITQSETDFLFIVESFGQHKPEVLIKEAASQLDKQLDSIAEALKKIK
ncbi:MAG TPA: DNA-directed RNA polymerase subunit D [Acidobacteriota bacterium]|nr:DNA-directed RNA polymerase subunit D [Acidobacteriota bacterium]